MVNHYSDDTLCAVASLLRISNKAMQEATFTDHKLVCPETSFFGTVITAGIVSLTLVGAACIGAVVYYKYNNSNQNEEYKVDCIGEGVELQEILS